MAPDLDESSKRTIEDLKRQRSGLLSSIKKTTSASAIDDLLTSTDVVHIESKIVSVESSLSKHQVNIQCLLQYLPDSEVPVAFDEVAENEARVAYLKGRLAPRIAELQPKSMSPNAPSTSSAAAPLSPPQFSRRRLKFVGEPFDGNYLRYGEWHDRFMARCYNDSTASLVEKFDYLIQSITGDAAAAISNLTQTAANFESAVQILQRRFGRKLPRISAHVSALLKLPEGGGDGSVRSLRQTVDTMRAHVRSLQNLGVVACAKEDVSAILGPILFSRLPRELCAKWYEESQVDGIKVVELLEFVEKKVEAMELSNACLGPSQSPVPTSSGKASSSGNNRGQQQHLSKTTTLVTDTAPSRPPCPFDRIHHHPAKCSAARSLSSSKVRDIIKRSGRCATCFGHGHGQQNCSFNPHCPICSGDHMFLLCPQRNGGKKPELEKKSNSNSSTETPSNSSITMHAAIPSSNPSEQVLLQTACTTIVGPHEARPVRLLLDSGSQASFIEENLADELQLTPVRKEHLQINTFGGQATNRQVKVYRLALRTKDSFLHMDAYGVPNIAAKTILPVVDTQVCHLRHLLGLDLADVVSPPSTTRQIQLLLGAGMFSQVLRRDPIRIGGPNEPIATSTIFGWVLSGPLPSSQSSGSSATFLIHAEEHEDSIRDFLQLEKYGTQKLPALSQDDATAVSLYDASVEYTGTRYQVRLPFRPGHGELKSNYFSALSRLRKLLARLSRDPKLNEMYRAAIKTMEDMDFVEDAPKESESGIIFYLPHHPVVRETSKTYKCRPVFGGNAKGSNGVALNDCLLVGPPLVPEIPDILLRFRIPRFVATSDIVKAFLQVSLNPMDRDVCRFFWVNDDSSIREMRFKVVTFGLSSSPFLLNQTIQHHISLHLSNSCPKGDECTFTASQSLLQEMSKSFYVDNLMLGADSADSLVSKSTAATQLMQEAGMELTQWTTSDPQITGQLTQVGLSAVHESSSKVLGLSWEVSDDMILIRDVQVPKEFSPTKRNFLSLVATIFDPLGLLAPITVRAKLLLQRIWIAGYDWDTSIDDTSLLHELNSFLADITHLSDVRIPRQVPSDGRLIVFCDASKEASVAAVFLSGRLLISKNRVAKRAEKSGESQNTIPKLELIACLMGARLLRRVASALSLLPENGLLFTDSMIALHWILNPKPNSGVFVRNRVAKIRALVPLSSWRHVRSEENPSDVATRANCSLSKLLSKDLWFNGPPWLSEPQSDWPEQPEELPIPLPSVTCLVTAPAENPEISKPFQLSRFSSFSRAVRTASWVHRFSIRARAGVPANHPKGELLQEELRKGELLLVQQEQKASFPNEWEALTNGDLLPPSSSLLKLRPRWDNDQEVIVTVGRESPKPLILLPYNSRFTHLLLLNLHSKGFHCGPEHVLAKSREDYWIISGRQAAKSAIRSCKVCSVLRLPQYQQVESALPPLRTTAAPPFWFTGVDYTGHFYVFKEGQPENIVKVYILLFSCGVTRALHLELTEDMAARSLFQAYRRFVARRGHPGVILSDNAKSFLRLKKMLPKVEWRLIPDRSPWWGALYERMVRSIKEALRPVVGRKLLSVRELETLLFEIESVINSRPLFAVSDDIDDAAPLTPNSFLLPGQGQISSAESRHFKPGTSGPKLLDSFKTRRRSLNLFWMRWKKSYLSTLHRWRTVDKPGPEPKVNDVVLVQLDGATRFKWPLGRIVSIIPGRDGVVRAARVLLQGGTIVRRATKLLFPLELAGIGPPVVAQEERTPMLPEPPVPEIDDASQGTTRDGSAEAVPAPAPLRAPRVRGRVTPRHKRLVIIPPERFTRAGRKIQVPRRFFE